MSYDLTIWCVEPFNDPSLLPSAEKWGVGEDHWEFESRTWLINTGPSDRVLEEDIPDEVVGQLPGIRYMVGVSLEPLGAPKAGYTMLWRFARAVAKEARGVIVDPQEDSVTLARGTKRYLPPKRDKEERFGLLEMSWWMTNDRLLQERHLEEFLCLMERYLPEALPRRYGQYEPPQHLFAETGREHLKTFLTENLTDTVVWYATRPVGHWSFSLDRECGWRRMGGSESYRCNSISISFDAAALRQPGWPQGLRRFWRNVSNLVEPFFGDVRTLKGYTGRLPHVWSDAQTENHPVRSWWWMGVPPKLGHAIVVGEPYISLWPQLQDVAEADGDLRFATTEDWSTENDVGSILDVPPDISLPFMPSMQESEFGGSSMRYPETYPENFPFGPLPPSVPTHKPEQVEALPEAQVTKPEVEVSEPELEASNPDAKASRRKRGWKFWRW